MRFDTFSVVTYIFTIIQITSSYVMSNPTILRAPGTGSYVKYFPLMRREPTANKRSGDVREKCMQGFCEKCDDYPAEEIERVLKEKMLPHGIEFYIRPYKAPTITSRFNVVDRQENLCTVLQRNLTPRTAKSVNRRKEYVVQTEDSKQSIFMEVCKSDGIKFPLPCLPDDYEVQCVQQYRVIPLLTFNERTKSIESNQFKVPSGCAAEYRKMRFIPVGEV